MDIYRRLEEIELLRERFEEFDTYLEFGMTKMGFKCTEVQKNIAEFISSTKYGNRKMVQAARGQAKTTICALYVQWRLIHNPALRALVVTASGDFAKDITKMIRDCIMEWDELACLRPDGRGRQSAKAFDVYFDLKGVNKSPSVLCKGIDSALAGNRADLLIADDIENRQNSRTDLNREQLLNGIDEFPNLANDGGDIIFLGTPQSMKSIYNHLPAKGYWVRIWTGRVPRKEEVANYEGKLAPYIMGKVNDCGPEDYCHGLDLNQGPAIDEIINGENTLYAKELNNRADFRLQMMLDTSLSDLDMYPLRVSDLLFINVDREKGLPAHLHTTKNNTSLVTKPQGHTLKSPLYMADALGGEYIPINRTIMAIDPAGGGANGDETGYAIVGQSGDRLVILDAGGLKGGYNSETYEKLSGLLLKWNINELVIEKNFGYGAFQAVWQNHAMYKEHIAVPIVEVQSSGKKEDRICDTLEPFINGRKLIVDLDLVENDWKAAMAKDKDKLSYSLILQMAEITREKDSLKHDDRIDALAIAVSHLQASMYEDTMAIEMRMKQAEDREWFENVYGIKWDEYIQSKSNAVNFQETDYTHPFDQEPNNGIDPNKQAYESMVGMVF